MARPKTEDPPRMFVAVDSVTFPSGEAVRAGQRRPANDPLVQRYPDWFADETGTSPEEIVAKRQAEQEATIRASRGDDSEPSLNSNPWLRTRILRQPEPSEYVLCTVREYVGVGRDGTPTRATVGDKLRADDPLVAGAPAHVFRPVEEVFPEAAA
jgi:hypothetical protein